MTDIVHSARPGLLRRIIAFPLTLLVLGFVWVTLIAVAVIRAYEALGFERNTPARAMGAVLAAAAAIAAYKLFKRWVERSPETELTLPGAWQELGGGIAFGAALFSVATGIVALMGGFEVLGLRGAGQIWSMLAVAVFSGVFEEIMMRGILLRHLETMLGTWAALGISAAIFGALHLPNPGATMFAAFAIAMEAGLLLGAAYLLTRRLWLPIGIHAAWNFTQGWVYSIPVSGGDAPLGLLITRRVGPDWLTGGDFGLEASVVALIVATAAGAAMLILAVRRGRVVRPMWRR